MLIGLKFDIGFSQDKVYRRLYGDRKILAFLRGLGVEVVETPVGPEVETADLQDHIARCADLTRHHLSLPRRSHAGRLL